MCTTSILKIDLKGKNSQAAPKFKCSQVYISKTLKTMSLIRLKKKKKILFRTCHQIGSARTKCGWLYRISTYKLLIFNDESLRTKFQLMEIIFIIQVTFIKHRQVSNSSPLQNLKRNYSFGFAFLIKAYLRQYSQKVALQSTKKSTKMIVSRTK